MATIRKRGDSYQIRVSVGYDTKGTGNDLEARTGHDAAAD
ncbi:unknown [Ruminococcus sp. CAG:353]|nr:unknown [Ruminococcus sp. CAG:353]